MKDVVWKFSPKCMSNKIQMAMTNRGHLIPCCWCDEEWSLKTPAFAKLLKVSKVSEVEDIEEIIMSKEWLEFEENLRLEKNIPKICIDHCMKKEDDDDRKIETIIDNEGNLVDEHKV